MKALNTDQIVGKLKSHFQNKSYIDFVYLFGSVARGEVKPLSDFDVAVCIDSTQAPDDLFDIRLKLLSELFNVLQTEKVDLIILNQAPVELSFRILKDGKLVFERDRQMRIDFREKVVREYLDKRYFLNQRHEIIREEMMQGDYFD